MMDRFLLTAGAALALMAVPAGAIVVYPDEVSAVTGGGGTSLPPYLQCVPYARKVSGIQIFGDAHTWWGQAEGRYARGYRPKVGAVLAFKPHGNSRLGHVAAVSRIVDSRTILIRHANWSPINGRRGQIENDVRVVDVSTDNDWSAVRVWYAPIGNLGAAQWPVQGFIYPSKPGKLESIGGRREKAGAAAKPESRSNDPIGDLIKQRLGF